MCTGVLRCTRKLKFKDNIRNYLEQVENAAEDKIDKITYLGVCFSFCKSVSMTKVHEYTLKGKAEFKDNVCIILTIIHVELFLSTRPFNQNTTVFLEKQGKKISFINIAFRKHKLDLH